MKKSGYHVGTIRIKAKDLLPYEKTKTGWKKGPPLPDATKVIDLYKAHKTIGLLQDEKDPTWLKGFLTKEKQCRGARITTLPNKELLEKPFSLFAPHLTLHDESSGNHWDVIFQNPNGNYAYLYTIKKRTQAKKKKFGKVSDFERVYPLLIRKTQEGLYKKDPMALPMMTLLETRMRVGNELYYKAHHHKGLTTLKREDVTMKGNNVTFNYIAKEGVPRTITKRFSPTYIARLKELLKKKKKEDFLFTGVSNHPLKDTAFTKTFKEYTKKAFYPHIVRSHYATQRAQEFLRRHPRKATKEEVLALFREIAQELGHKRYSRKKGEWEANYTTTIHHYIEPSLVEKIQKRGNLVKKKKK